jgi:hypothetical protein
LQRREEEPRAGRGPQVLDLLAERGRSIAATLNPGNPGSAGAVQGLNEVIVIAKLPKKPADRLDVMPGDDLQILEHEGRITILKRVKGASRGVLSHIKIGRTVSDSASRDDAMAKAGRGAARKAVDAE